jgi:hypothetical protein
VSDWDRFSDLMATLAAASLTWVSGVLAPDLPINAIEVPGSLTPFENRQDLMIGWAQSAEEPPIEQVGEDTGEDVETLDEAAPAAEDVAPEEDIETLDQGSPPLAGDGDIEPLDQGSPPATTQAPITEAPAPSVVAEVPVTPYVAPEPVAASGPVIPAGFGTGNVHVSAGNAAFPAGLADCHVGAVTGRAYVGIDCEEGSSVVGHAPSFEEFPFVVDEGFPFNRESVFTDMSEDAIADDADVFVSAARGQPLGDDTGAPEVRATGASSVELAQEARNHKPRVEFDSGDANRRTDRNRGGNVSAAQADNSDDRTKGEAKGNKRHGDKDQNSRASAGEKEKKSKHAKKQGSQKGKKGRESKNR